MSLWIPAGETWEETRVVGTKRVQITCENTTDEPLVLDDEFRAGLFVQAAADGQSEYEWEFDPPVRATVEAA